MMTVDERERDLTGIDHLQQIAVLQQLIGLLDMHRLQMQGDQHVVESLQTLVIA